MQENRLDEYEAYTQAGNEVVAINSQQIAVPKRFTLGAREIWQIQLRLPKRGGQRAYRLAQQPRFRAAYDFLLLRAQITPKPLQELADWWTEYQKKENVGQKQMIKELPNDKPAARRRKPRRRYPNKKPSQSSDS